MPHYEFLAHIAVDANSASDAAMTIDGLLEHVREAAEFSWLTHGFSIELDEASPDVIEDETQ
jgi:hypothetical protein